MTDKELKDTLQSTLTNHSSFSDETEFTHRVMSQLPQSRLKWSIVWMIRVLAAVIGLICLWLITPMNAMMVSLLSLCSQLSSLLVAGWLVAGITLFICRQRQIL